jgi:predicted nuclease of predicted toxin-antitoxin system
LKWFKKTRTSGVWTKDGREGNEIVAHRSNNEQVQRQIFLTRDKDFGNLVFVKVIETGVRYLRMTSATQNKVLDELE